MNFPSRLALCTLLLVMLGFSSALALAAAERGVLEKPAGLGDADWVSLKEAVRKSIRQQAKLTGDTSVLGAEAALFDNLGYAVALAGDTALVGALGDDVGPINNQGAVYVYTRSGTIWTQQAKLLALDGGAGDQFGSSVALVGDTALVGAYSDDVGANTDQGSAYVFTRSGTTWTQQAKLLAGNGAANDQFGNSVAGAGDTALVGAFQDDVGANSNQSSAYVYIRSGISWTQQAKLVLGAGAAFDQFGYPVAIAGDTALVGATFNDIGSNRDQGSVFVYTRSGST